MHTTTDRKKFQKDMTPNVPVSAKWPASSSLSLPTTYLSESKIQEKKTKSMHKYELELQMKNRVLREKEKAIFNQGVL